MIDLLNTCKVFAPEEYQEWGIAHLQENKHAGLFAGMGLGKTAMTMAAMVELLLDGSCRSFLVVAPIRVCNLTWPNEAEKWAQFNWLKVANLRTKEGMEMYHRREAQIYVINYEALPAFVHRVLQPEFKRRKNLAFDGIVWDELSKAKNPASVRINSIRVPFWEHITYHWGLTGTPAPNGQIDLFAQIRLLDNGARLGKSFFQFRGRYFYATDQENHHWRLRSDSRERLEAKLADIVLVLKSSDWLDIPDTVVEDVEVAMSPEAKKVYKKFAKELYMLIGENEVEAVNAAVLVNKLLQITSGAIYDTERNVVPLHDAKLKALKGVVKHAEGPLMVCYMYQHERDRIKKEFPEAVLFSDAKSHTQQDELAKKWNKGKIPLMVVSPQSVGHGLNLQDGGSEICWFSLPWSRELYDQMNARVARKGQKRVSKIYRLLVPETMDDACAETLKEKGDNQSQLLDALHNFKRLMQTT